MCLQEAQCSLLNPEFVGCGKNISHVAPFRLQENEKNSKPRKQEQKNPKAHRNSLQHPALWMSNQHVAQRKTVKVNNKCTFRVINIIRSVFCLDS